MRLPETASRTLQPQDPAMNSPAGDQEALKAADTYGTHQEMQSKAHTGLPAEAVQYGNMPEI